MEYEINVVATNKIEGDCNVEYLFTYDNFNSMEDVFKTLILWLQDNIFLYMNIVSIYKAKDDSTDDNVTINRNIKEIIYQREFIHLGGRNINNIKHKHVIFNNNINYIIQIIENSVLSNNENAYINVLKNLKEEYKYVFPNLE